MTLPVGIDYEAPLNDLPVSRATWDLDAERAAVLDRAADLWIADAETKSFAREQGLRQAVRSDIETGRDWARERTVPAD